MEPFLHAGDKARIVVTDEYVLGDICMIQRDDGEFVLHRIVELQENIIVSKGDFTRKVESVPHKNIVGKSEAFWFQECKKWFVWQPNKNDLEKLTKYSLMISPKYNPSRKSRALFRKMIWNLNLQMKDNLIKERY